MLQKFNSFKDRGLHHLNKHFFEKNTNKVTDTPPIKYEKNSEVKIVSMLGHTQVNMFILALKSFVRFYPWVTIDILDDTTLINEDHSVLKHHIPGVNIISIDTIDTQDCPKRNCWERLVYIVEQSKNSYVIQLDSDTLTLNPCLDVYTAINNNQGFVIGGRPWTTSISTKNMSYIASSWKNNHIQVVAERALSSLNTTKNINYLRGCAAFTGFAKNSLEMAWLNSFSNEMTEAIGKEKWNQWGSEQLASNIILSNSEKAHILAWPQYQNFMFPETKSIPENENLIHFIGSNRYKKRIYEKLAKQLIEQI